MDILPSRVEKYRPDWLDFHSFSGQLIWGRMRPPVRDDEAEPQGGALTRVVPITLAFREDLLWMLPEDRTQALSRARPQARAVYETLQKNGALFFHDLQEVTGYLPTQLEDALSELATLGFISADGFSAIRSLAQKKQARPGRSRWGRRRPSPQYGQGGRWTLFPGRVGEIKKEERLQAWAWQLLRRYGVLFKDLLSRESVAPSWYELVPILRRMEARGEARGGRFVGGVAGEQYAIPEAVELLRRPRDTEDTWAIVSATDPLNLVGILNPSPRVPSFRGNRILYHNGAPVAAFQGSETQFLVEVPDALREPITRALRLQVLPLREELLKEIAETSAISK